VAAETSAGPQRALLGVWLAVVAGFVDAVGYLVLHREFVAHMTGNTNQLGQQLAHVSLLAAVPLIVAVATFVISIALVTLGIEVAAQRGIDWQTGPALLFEALLLAVFMVYGADVTRHGTVPGRGVAFYICAISAVAAMGVQTAALTKWGSRTIRTTYLSGMLTCLGQESARLLAGRTAGGSRRAGDAPSGTAVLVYVSLFAGFLGGGVFGTWALGRLALWSLAVPLGAVVAAAVYEAWQAK
jgi:uncharacterized membrane protein YoaK (UPF0700 family)